MSLRECVSFAYNDSKETIDFILFLCVDTVYVCVCVMILLKLASERRD